MPSETISFHTPQGKLPSQIDYWVRRLAHGPELEDYLMLRNNWDLQTLHSTDWEAYETATDTKPALIQMNICKYVHGWQNVGIQKRRIDTILGNYFCST